MPDEANLILHLQPSSLTPKSYSNSEMYHQSVHRQQHCPDPSAEKILPTCFHDHLHLESLLLHKPCPARKLLDFTLSIRQVFIKEILMIVQFLAISSLFSQLVKEMQEWQILPWPNLTIPFFFKNAIGCLIVNSLSPSLPSLIKQSQLPPNSKLCFLRVFTRKFIKGCLKYQLSWTSSISTMWIAARIRKRGCPDNTVQFFVDGGHLFTFFPLDHSSMQ